LPPKPNWKWKATSGMFALPMKAVKVVQADLLWITPTTWLERTVLK
jgi:hypothetical protein